MAFLTSVLFLVLGTIAFTTGFLRTNLGKTVDRFIEQKMNETV